MGIKQRVTTWAPVGKQRRRYLVISILLMCILLCGFTFDWFVEFTTKIAFPESELPDQEMIVGIESYIDGDEFKDSFLAQLSNTAIAEQLMGGIQTNLSASVYDNIELPEMCEESPGKKIIQTIFDRLFK